MSEFMEGFLPIITVKHQYINTQAAQSEDKETDKDKEARTYALQQTEIY